MKLRPSFLKEPHKSLHPGPKRYRLVFTNENTFNTVWAITLSRIKVWMLTIAAVSAIICLVAIIVLGTPLRAILPGYLKPEERHSHIHNTLRVDSMQEVMNLNTAYITNIRDILTDNISMDSIATAESTALMPDTLKMPSDKETEFVKQWEERERYNLTVITPLAAKAMSFHKPAINAVADTSADAKTLMLTMPRHSGVMAIHTGTVINQIYVPDKGYSVMIQHPNDFISHYSQMADIFVRKGTQIKSGQVIGLSASNTKTPLLVEIWHKGTAAKPFQLLEY